MDEHDEVRQGNQAPGDPDVEQTDPVLGLRPDQTDDAAGDDAAAFETRAFDAVPDEPTPDVPGTDVPGTDVPWLDPTEDLAPAMAVSSPTGSFTDAPTPEVKAGHVLADRYRLEQQLAQRGGTVTWRAFDQKLSRSVLVHLLGARDPRTVDVLDAARKAATATDSRFLRVLDAVEPVGDEPAVVVCEFAPGESLERLLKQGPLSALEAAWMARELADAMSSMHAEGLFHQRLNPDTVIITATGSVKVVGFLIEAALHPDAQEGTLAWSEREQADVRAIGKVLYASLVNRWPTDPEALTTPDGQPVHRWGMAAAPFDNRGWLTPRQVRSGVSPALDVICDQVLSEAPRQNEMPIRTASQLVIALNKVLGTADASADLERRMRYPVVAADEWQGEDTGRMAALDDVDETTTMASAAQPFTAVPAPASTRTATSPVTPADSPTVVRGASIIRPRPRPANRRWLVILVGVVLLVLLASLLRFAWNRATGGGGDEGGNSGGTAQTYVPTKVDDFDPEADGGNAEENPNRVKYAWDGNKATAWQTLQYLNSAKFGKLKPGVGLVVDLGQQVSVGEVNLSLEGSPTGVQLRVPNDTNAAEAPMDKASSWKTVASVPTAGATAQLKPASPVTTRYLLVYVTSLPNIGSNKYRAGISEIEVKS